MEKKIITSSSEDVGVSRRDFFKVASAYGMSSTIMAATALGSFTLPQLAQASEANAKKTFQKTSKAHPYLWGLRV